MVEYQGKCNKKLVKKVVDNHIIKVCEHWDIHVWKEGKVCPISELILPLGRIRRGRPHFTGTMTLHT